MDDREFKDLVIGTLKQLINRQDNLENSIQQFRQETSAEFQQLRQETREEIQ